MGNGKVPLFPYGKEFTLETDQKPLVSIYVMHQRDRLFSCQLCGAYAPRFPPSGEGMC